MSKWRVPVKDRSLFGSDSIVVEHDLRTQEPEWIGPEGQQHLGPGWFVFGQEEPGGYRIVLKIHGWHPEGGFERVGDEVPADFSAGDGVLTDSGEPIRWVGYRRPAAA